MKVVNLNTRKPCPKMIQMAEKLLAEVKAGKVESLALVFLSHDDSATTAIHSIGDKYAMLGAITHLSAVMQSTIATA